MGQEPRRGKPTHLHVETGNSQSQLSLVHTEPKFR